LVDHDLSMRILYRFHGWLIFARVVGSPFHVCLTICPFAHLVYATSHLSFVAFYSYLVSWLSMIWACAYYSDFTDGTQDVRTDIWSNKHEKGYLQLSQKLTIREIGIICACSDHGQSRYQMWIKCNKRQMTSCIHKMCERTFGQTNMKRAITLAKITHPWNRNNMHMLRSWTTKIPNMNKMRQKTND
jgi:hypothetical protein